MTGRLLFGAWLVVVWTALWGDVSVANLASGVLVAAVLLVAFPLGTSPRGRRVRPLALVRLAAYFAYKLVESNLVVAWEVITPASRINNAIVAVPLRTDDDVLQTLLANMISLTPGTLTIEVRREPATLYVHVLHLHSIAATREEVQRLEDLTLAAFGVTPSRSEARAV